MAAEPEKEDLGDCFRKHGKELRVFIRMMAPRSNEHEDILQSVFVRLLVYMSTIKVLNWLPYAKQAALNEILARANEAAKCPHSVSELSAEDLEKMAERLAQLGDCDAAEDLAQKAELDRALQTLSPRQQIVFRRCYLEGHKPASVAAELGVSPRTVRSDLLTAYQHIAADSYITVSGRSTKDDRE